MAWKKNGFGVLSAIVCLGVLFSACPTREEDSPFFFYGFPDAGRLYVHSGVAANFNTPPARDVDGLLDRAAAFIKAGEPRLALEDINRVLVDYGRMRVSAVGLRVLAFINAGDYARALEDINVLGRNFYSSSQNDAWLSHVAGLVHALTGNLEQAEESFLVAIFYDPRYYGLAVEHLRLFRNRIRNAPENIFSREEKRWLLNLTR